MPVPGGSFTIERRVEVGFPTGVASDDSLASERTLRAEGHEEGWNQIIDKHLVEWGRNPSRFDPDEIVPPSPFIVAAACRVAMRLREAGWAAPLRVVPDGDGGIAFERRAGECFESLELAAQGQIELITFHKSKVIRRDRLPDVSEWA